MNGSADWLATGGAYWVIGGSWLFIAVGMYVLGDRIGRAARAENDGCLIGIMNILLTLFGGGVGLYFFKYPTFVVTSFFGALLFPTLGTLLVLSRMSRKR